MITPTAPAGIEGEDAERLVPAEIADLSATARLAYVALDEYGALSHQDLHAHTRASRNSVTQAVTDLKEAGVVLERPDPDDGRRQRYVLAEQLRLPGGGSR